MTRKDYELWARLLREMRPKFINEAEFADHIGKVVGALLRDNPRFNIEKFVAEVYK